MRVAALYDIHGNLPALGSVLADLQDDHVDMLVIGGDVVTGPMPAETLARLQATGYPTRWVMGNADREVIQAFDSPASDDDPEDPNQRLACWVASRLTPAHRDLLYSFEPTVAIEGLAGGSVFFCHGSPRSDTEMITSLTPPERLEPMLAGVSEKLVVCGHTHRQFDLAARHHRIVNAGAVGMPYEGEAAAFWLLVDSTFDFRKTHYDVDEACMTFRAIEFPVDDMFEESLIQPADPDSVARYFEQL